MQALTLSQEIEQAFKRNLSSSLVPIMAPLFHSAPAIKEIEYAYNQAQNQDGDEPFAQKILDAINLQLDVSDEDLDLIPQKGPLLIVANHPYGGIEGLALLALLRRVRPDVKLMANYLLGVVPELKDDFLLINPFGSNEAPGKNVTAVRDALKWLKDDHVVGIFPAGDISTYQRKERAVIDKEWAELTAMMAQKSKCAVQAVYFDGHNSKLFQAAGMIRPELKTLLLAREFIRQKNNTLKLKIGNVVSAEKCAEFATASELTDYLRLRTYILSTSMPEKLKLKQKAKQKAKKVIKKLKLCKHRDMEAIAPPVNRELLVNEINDLSLDSLLLASGDYQVYCAKAKEIPVAMQELGRLREETFRAIGEGTGNASDTDWWDEHYRHLILWHRKDQEIIGAYRMGLTDELLSKFGAKGLYSATLFKYSDKMLSELAPALELGRSFIQGKYQKSPSALGLLWKGIMAFVHRYPRYSKLFGPVSISNAYHSMSQNMMVDFLHEYHFDERLSNEVSPKNPPKFKEIKIWDRDSHNLLKTLSDLDELIAEVEPHLKNAPVLIRQYLRLNGKFLGFNVDPDFNDTLDALILCDVAKASGIASRYMGKEKFAEFMEWHKERK
jgi:putative hemolysin